MTRREMIGTIGLLPFIQLRITTPVVKTDIVGTLRPQGKAYDIGAYEYVGTAQPVKPNRPGDVRLTR